MTAKMLSVLAVIGLVALIGSAAAASEMGPGFEIPTGDLPESAPPFGVPPSSMPPVDAPPFGLGDPGLGVLPDVPAFDVPPVMDPPDDTPPWGLPDGALLGDVVEVARTEDALTLTMTHPQADLFGLSEPFFVLHLVFGDGAPDMDGPLAPLGTSLDHLDLVGDPDLLEPLSGEAISLTDSTTGSLALTAVSVPEPSSLLLAILGASLMLCRPRSTRP